MFGTSKELANSTRCPTASRYGGTSQTD